MQKNKTEESNEGKEENNPSSVAHFHARGTEDMQLILGHKFNTEGFRKHFLLLLSTFINKINS